MTFFSQDGHLSPKALQALIDGSADEMQCLEAAEHLSFCDTCLAQYTALLTDDVLLVPPQPVAPVVMRRLRRRGRRISFGRYAAVAAAACLAVVIWFAGSSMLPASGLISPPSSTNDNAAATSPPAANSPDTQQKPSRFSQFGTNFSSALDSAASSAGNFFNGLFMPEQPTPLNVQATQARIEAGRAREAVFAPKDKTSDADPTPEDSNT